MLLYLVKKEINMSYFDELCRAMKLLADNPKVMFMGQSVKYPGNAIYKTLEEIPEDRRIELPVAEDMQMGMSIGMSLAGYIPVSIFPRFDFLLLAVNQLVNHLDKIQEMSHGEFSPKVIIRTAVGSTSPLYPGLQHCQDYTDAFRLLLKNVEVVKLEYANQVVLSYIHALNSPGSTLLIEVSDLYNSVSYTCYRCGAVSVVANVPYYMATRNVCSSCYQTLSY